MSNTQTHLFVDSVVVESSSIDLDHANVFKKPWLLVLESGKIFEYNTAKEAFDMQVELALDLVY